MNTYVIIPIKFLEEKLENYEHNLDIESALVDFKQISLDETDINTKAYNHLAKLTEEELEFGTAELIINSYTKALKDLL